MGEKVNLELSQMAPVISIEERKKRIKLGIAGAALGPESGAESNTGRSSCHGAVLARSDERAAAGCKLLLVSKARQLQLKFLFSWGIEGS